MNNLFSVLWIMSGTYVCASNPEAFLNEDGSYHHTMGIVTAIACYGLICLFDLSFSAGRNLYIICKRYFKKYRKQKDGE